MFQNREKLVSISCVEKINKKWWMKNTEVVIGRFPQWYNLTLAPRFWATKVCLQASKISKICLFGHPTGRVTSWNANFENCSWYSLIKWYQFLSVWAILLFVSGSRFSCLLVPLKVMPHYAKVSCLIIKLTINAVE